MKYTFFVWTDCDGKKRGASVLRWRAEWRRKWGWTS